MLKNLVSAVASRLGYIVKKRTDGITRSMTASDLDFSSQVLMSLIHGKNIYEGFDYPSFDFDPQGWGSQSPAFGKIIEKHRPQFIIEVGSWKGGSTLTMAKELKNQRLDSAVILCIDTWLGAVEFWEDQEDQSRFKSLACKHGFPQVYYTFLANVCHAGF